ncbi:WD repeat-containing protein WRAP73-like [Sycon ciliatum]|uniref:WD repeat-containing protein WRAP73-like n=1 Tax=Sycon ciliatum TaxID=27933 RepID=UPI0031F6EE68
MNFSESFKHSNFLCQYSPNGKYVASASQHRLVVRSVSTLQIEHLFTCNDVIQELEWSPDSALILCGMFKRSLIQVWSLEQPEWACKIDEGWAGVIAVRWAPNSRHILTTLDFNLRVVVWSLLDKSISYIKYPKGFMDFSKDGRYLALAERRDCKDYVSVFDCNVWQLCKHFAVDTRDSSGLAWSPDGSLLAVWDSPVNFKILLYSPDGRCLGTYSAYDNALAIKSVSWSSSGQFCAIGCYDQKVRLLNHLTWKPSMEFDHPTSFSPKKSTTVVYQEVVIDGPQAPIDMTSTLQERQRIHRQQSRYDIFTGRVRLLEVKPDPEKPNPRLGVGLAKFSVDSVYLATRNGRWLPIYSLCHAYNTNVYSIIRFPRLSGYFSEKRMCAIMLGLAVYQYIVRVLDDIFTGRVRLLEVKPDPEKPNPRLGVGLAKFSVDSVYLATRNDNQPNTVWIWDMLRLTLVALLMQTSPVRCLEWSPVTTELAVCSGTSHVYIWSPAGCTSTSIPTDLPFPAQRLSWSPCGDSFTVMSKERFCVCYHQGEMKASQLEE